jgi:uncharacterized glyoxalase superfamily protein PhnB
MSMRLNPYLTFTGNARAAMKFYSTVRRRTVHHIRAYGTKE